LDPRCGHSEAVASPTVVVGIEQHLEIVILAAFIATHELVANGPRITLPHDRTDIQRALVEEHVDRGRFFGRRALHWLSLHELRRWPCLVPRSLRDPAIYVDLAVSMHGHDGRDGCGGWDRLGITGLLRP
jgi:hypothetical protein